MPADTIPELSAEQLAEIERKYDPETAFRATGKILGFWISAALVAMSVYHFYASGFGLVRELVHRGIHLSFVLGLVFLLFGLVPLLFEGYVHQIRPLFFLLELLLKLYLLELNLLPPLLPLLNHQSLFSFKVRMGICQVLNFANTLRPAVLGFHRSSLFLQAHRLM